MKKLDVLVINPSALDQIYQSLSREYAAIEPPIWGALLANGVRAKGKSVEILDCEAENLTVDAATKRVAEYDPKLTVIVVYGQQPSASTQNMYAASILSTSLKQNYPDRKILLVGGHCSALPERTLNEEKVDFVCQGEGLYTIMGLLESKMDDVTSVSKISGLWYRAELSPTGKPLFTSPTAVIPQENLPQELPGMAWDLLPMKKYRAHNWHCFSHIADRQPYASVYTSLGCPFRCAFCCINAPFGKSSFRYWDPSFMIKQFDILANQYGVKNVKIADEMFVLRDSHFLELCKLLKERNYGFNIWAYSRVDTMKPHHLEALKDAGVNWIVLGIESKSKFVRDGVTKGKFDEGDIVGVVKQIQNAGINVHGNYIFGLPDDDLQSMKENLEMAMDLNCEMSNFYSAMAYPGSQLYSMAIENKWELPETWLGYSQHAFETKPLPTKHISAGEVLAFRDWAWQQYFTSPKYLDLVKSKFGMATHQHLLDLTKHKLKRKFAADLDFTKLGGLRIASQKPEVARTLVQ